MSLRIYLDNNATTPLDPRVSDYIIHVLPNLIGNPSSTHAYGREARALIGKARDNIAAFLEVKPHELTFTSGGTESVNTAMRCLANQRPPGHIITSSAEHSCVIAVCKLLEAGGHSVTYLAPGQMGAVTPEAIRSAIRPDTRLIALMAVNNETGVKTDIPAIAKIAEDRQISFFVDAIAQLGKEKVEIPKGVTAMAFSGHKIHALQGIGVTFMRSGIKNHPLIVGGEQEYGRRAGTENLLGILSFAKAVEILANESGQTYDSMQRLREKFESALLESLPNTVINGEGSRTSNVSNIAFLGIDGEALLVGLDHAGIAASHGSACSSGALEPSRVLLSMGLPLERVRSSIRFSISHLTTQVEISMACERIINLVKHLQNKH